jgi:hypothetical protein
MDGFMKDVTRKVAEAVKGKVSEAVKGKVAEAVSGVVANSSSSSSLVDSLKDVVTSNLPESKDKSSSMMDLLKGKGEDLLETKTRKMRDLLETGTQKMQSIIDSYKTEGYKPTPFNQLWSWLIFLCFFMFSWQLTIQTVTRRLDEQLASYTDKSHPLRRPYLIAVCAYSLVVFLLNMTILYIFAFIGCTTLVLSSQFVPFLIEPLIYALFLPEIVFSAISLYQIPFHFFVLFTAFTLHVGMVWFYISEREINSHVITRAKMIRILCIVPGAFLGIVYGCYAIYCAMSMS